jgi:hypothetical protein
MKNDLIKIAKKYKCQNIEVEFVNNFDWKYYCINMDDENGLHLDFYDFEYCIYDENYKEEQLLEFENWLKEQLKQQEA